MAAANSLLEVTRDRDGFHLSGEIDLSNVDQLAAALVGEVRQGNHLILDCSNLRFIDSTGMAALINISKGLGAKGRLTLRTVPPQVAKAVRVLGLDRMPNLEIADPATSPGAAATA